MATNKPHIVFFGTSLISVDVFSVLFERGIRPLFLVTTPDAPKGRHLELTPSPAKEWALKNGIEVIQPEKLKAPPFSDELKRRAPEGGYDLFIVASYGKIIPKDILDMPARGVLNVHPSLLPKYRGPSPIPSQILANDRDVGVTIMRMDEEMDHGPIVVQKRIDVPQWPLDTRELKKILGSAGAHAIADILPDWMEGTVTTQEQKHDEATYTKKFEKADGEIKLTDDPYKNYLKFAALASMTGIFFFTNSHKRVKITAASYVNNQFVIERVIPEGKKEMPYVSYIRGNQ